MPLDYHMLIGAGALALLSLDDLVNRSRPSIDEARESAAHASRRQLPMTAPSGADADGALPHEERVR